MVRKSLLFSLILSLLPCLVFSYGKIAPFGFPSARSAALGGRHAAFGDDFYSLFINPASLRPLKDEFSAAAISISTYGPAFELIDVLSSKVFNAVDLLGLMGEKGFSAGLELGGPLAVGWTGRGIGLGLFNRTTTDIVISGLSARPVVAEEFLLLGGYSYRFMDKNSHIIDAGFLGKGFFRLALEMEASIFSMEKLLDADALMLFPLVSTLGLGIDLGVRYEYGKSFAAAVVCHDVYSPGLVTTYDTFDGFLKEGNSASKSGETIRPVLDAGVSYTLKSQALEKYITRVVFMLDYRDILGFLEPISKNPVLNIGLGVEMRVLEVLDIRLGIADALPAAGIGLNLSFMRLEFAILGRELGMEPGVQPVYSLAFDMQFRY